MPILKLSNLEFNYLVIYIWYVRNDLSLHFTFTIADLRNNRWYIYNNVKKEKKIMWTMLK